MGEHERTSTPALGCDGYGEAGSSSWQLRHGDSHCQSRLQRSQPRRRRLDWQRTWLYASSEIEQPPRSTAVSGLSFYFRGLRNGEGANGTSDMPCTAGVGSVRPSSTASAFCHFVAWNRKLLAWGSHLGIR